jgi:hypothetical protein
LFVNSLGGLFQLHSLLIGFLAHILHIYGRQRQTTRACSYQRFSQDLPGQTYQSP